MDDGVVLEPLVGNRVQHSLNCPDDTMRLVWGPEGVNVEKIVVPTPLGAPHEL